MATIPTVKVSVDLSPDGFKKLAEYLKSMRHTLRTSYATELRNKSREEVKKNAIQNLNATIGLTGYTPTGEMATSWLNSRLGNTALLINTHEHSAAVEFGTGIKGSAYPHPNAGEVGYNYNINGHTKAWVYTPNGTDFFKTSGQEAHRFMYYALVDFKNSVAIQNIGIAAFSKYFKDVQL